MHLPNQGFRQRCATLETALRTQWRHLLQRTWLHGVETSTSKLHSDTAATDIDPASITLPGDQPTEYSASRKAGQEATQQAAHAMASTDVSPRERGEVMHRAAIERLGHNNTK